MKRDLTAGVEGFARRHGMLREGARMGAAVSGGADSVFLLQALLSLAPKYSLELEVLHLDHGLRGVESKGDAEFVAELARQHGLKLHLSTAGLSGVKGNVEQAAREARRSFFAAVREEAGLETIATGHTLDDQAETVLFRALRGASPAGLAGILPTTAEGLVRPLLSLRRGEIREWLRQEGVAWREDSSNRNLDLRRNLLRECVLPQVSAVNREAVEALGRLAELAREDEEYWRDVVEDGWTQVVDERAGGFVVHLPTLAGVAPALQRRIVREAARRAGARLDWGHVEQILELGRSPRGSGSVGLPGIEARRSFEELRLGTPLSREEWGIAVSGAGVYAREGFDWEVVVTQQDAESTPIPATSPYNEGSSRLEAELVAAPMTLRNWRAGDRYQPIGSNRERSLKDLFQERRIASWDRANWPILCSGERIVWAGAFGAAEWASCGRGGRIWEVGMLRTSRGMNPNGAFWRP